MKSDQVLEEKHDQNKQNEVGNYGPSQFWTVLFMIVHVGRLLYKQCFFV